MFGLVSPHSETGMVLNSKEILRTTKISRRDGGIFLFFSYLCGGILNEMTMSTKIVCVALLVLTIGLTACGGKKKNEDIITQRVVEVQSNEPVRMQEYHDERDVNWIGKRYRVTVDRQPCDTLPMVKDERGQKYVDNVFHVTVSRADGSVFFNRKFVKSNFSQYVNDDYRQTGILEGIVFDKADGDWLVFGASVGHPQTDEYIPLVIRLSRMGVLEVRQDQEMDTTNPQQDQEEEI